MSRYRDLLIVLPMRNLVPRVYSAFKMAAEGREDSGLYRYITHTLIGLKM